MNHASRTKRFGLPSRTGVLILLALVLAGCQSGGQADLVTRELRMQEDQIYAMEDYLTQYQQLLCEVRAENASLKRQLAEIGDGDTLPAPPRRDESTKPNGRAPARGPSFQSPGRSQPADGEVPMPPETELIDPDVPPPGTTMDVPRLEVRGQSPDSPVAGEWKVVVPTQEDETAPVSSVSERDSSAVHESIQGLDERPERLNGPARFVEIRGEVVANETGGGPRIVVDVQALSATFEPTHFEGAISLMLLEPRRDGPPHSLARWDYTAADAKAMLDEASQRGSLRFHLELPADTPTDRQTELWVRLMPKGGGKVLGHVAMDLNRPGQIGVKPDGNLPQDNSSIQQEADGSATVAERDKNAERENFEADGNNVGTPVVNYVPVPAIYRRDDEGWTTARPDRPGQVGADGVESSARWRAASGPIPEIVESMTPPRPVVSRPVVQQAAFVEAVKPAPTLPGPVAAPARRTAVRAAPVWAPERAGGADDFTKTQRDGQRAAAGPARPVWSPLR